MLIKTIHVEKRHSRLGIPYWAAWANHRDAIRIDAFAAERLDAVGFLVEKIIGLGVPLANSVGIDTNAGR